MSLRAAGSQPALGRYEAEYAWRLFPYAVLLDIFRTLFTMLRLE